jgi:hypothetical protein
MDTEKYIKGFNSGYILAAHKPDLAIIAPETPIANDYLDGLTDGKNQMEFEKTFENLNELDSLRNKGSDKELGFGLGERG